MACLLTSKRKTPVNNFINGNVCVNYIAAQIEPCIRANMQKNFRNVHRHCTTEFLNRIDNVSCKKHGCVIFLHATK